MNNLSKSVQMSDEPKEKLQLLNLTWIEYQYTKVFGIKIRQNSDISRLRIQF